MSKQSECAHEEAQYCGAILRVMIKFARHTNQSQQPSGLKETNQGCGLPIGKVGSQSLHELALYRLNFTLPQGVFLSEIHAKLSPPITKLYLWYCTFPQHARSMALGDTRTDIGTSDEHNKKTFACPSLHLLLGFVCQNV